MIILHLRLTWQVDSLLNGNVVTFRGMEQNRKEFPEEFTMKKELHNAKLFRYDCEAPTTLT